MWEIYFGFLINQIIVSILFLIITKVISIYNMIFLIIDKIISFKHDESKSKVGDKQIHTLVFFEKAEKIYAKHN